MGSIRNGANGGFSGKAGSVIGSNWRDIYYIKGLPKLSKKPATERQMEQRARFLTAVNFLQPVKKLLYLGFKTQKTGRATGYNIALHLTMADAITGTYPDLNIDYSKVMISKGGLGRATGAVMSATAPGTLGFSWDPAVNPFNTHEDDQAVILVYNPVKRLYIPNAETVTRVEGSFSMAIPADFSGDEVHAWMFFTDRDEKLVSESVYMGPVTVA